MLKMWSYVIKMKLVNKSVFRLLLPLFKPNHRINYNECLSLKLVMATVLFSSSCYGLDKNLTYYHDFWDPLYHGEILNYCLYDGSKCGLDVADKYCQLLGYESATKSIIAYNVGLTKYLDGCENCKRVECKGWDCNGFKLIRCKNRFSHTPVKPYYFNAQTFVLPRFNKYRVAWCYKDEKNCGKMAANSFCRQMGFMRVAEYHIDKEINATRAIGSGELCFGQKCQGFSSITCSRK